MPSSRCRKCGKNTYYTEYCTPCQKVRNSHLKATPQVERQFYPEVPALPKVEIPQCQYCGTPGQLTCPACVEEKISTLKLKEEPKPEVRWSEVEADEGFLMEAESVPHKSSRPAEKWDEFVEQLSKLGPMPTTPNCE